MDKTRQVINNYYPGIDSIILVGNPYAGQSTNTASVDLYNLTDSTSITNSLLEANQLYGERIFLQTGN
ncbi:hypothetical protein [Flavihumibacter sp. CACIAM 22H1]|uniref:hypothetical protein n=1 Tax=Flavihumibacter sp. CACIAM 22H1 TaxID=1812911 RepID=UPI0007A7F2CC|nr:hypothetical protein [Flavihumibacter sp. CACIAM 22H1]KYP16262.1 MAG: hypothetical protein A1D16_20175 [Flavihumibacter sp. CACIAM 22H1]